MIEHAGVLWDLAKPNRERNAMNPLQWWASQFELAMRTGIEMLVTYDRMLMGWHDMARRIHGRRAEQGLKQLLAFEQDEPQERRVLH